MAAELADFKAESKQLRNQELTMRRLEERARSLEAQLEAKVRHVKTHAACSSAWHDLRDNVPEPRALSCRPCHCWLTEADSKVAKRTINPKPCITLHGVQEAEAARRSAAEEARPKHIMPESSMQGVQEAEAEAVRRAAAEEAASREIA